MDYFGVFWFFLDFSDFLGFFEIFDFFDFFRFFYKFLRLLLKVTEVTTDHQKWPKFGKKQTQKDIFLPEGQKKASAEGRSPPQELEEGPRSGPHLLVLVKTQ